jgi:putative endonuclease
MGSAPLKTPAREFFGFKEGDKMWYTYILYSKIIDKYYTGVTDDLEWRLERHNSGWGKYTRKGIPWTIVYTEEYSNKGEALKRERYIKRMKSRSYIESLIKNAGGRPE